VAALVVVASLAPASNAQPTFALTWLLFMGSSVHVASTAYLFTEADVRAHVRNNPTRYVWVPTVLIVGAAVLAVAVPVRDLAWILLPYFAWQFFHFHKQNIGMVALAASTSALRGSSRAERQAMTLAACFGILGLIAHPDLLQLNNRTFVGHLFVVAAVGFAVAVVWGVSLLAARLPQERAVGFSATYLMALLYFVPVFIFASPYAAVGGMTVGHGLQYLLLLGLVAAGRSRGRQRMLGLALLVNLALVGGILLSATSHLHRAPGLERVLFGAYLGVVMTHFVVDAGIWRLRDPFPRQFMASHVPFLVRPDASMRQPTRS
jgi:hypothetical protein